MVQELDEEIPQELEDELLARENVVGVGRGRKRANGHFTDKEVIVVFVEQKVAEDELDEDQIIPATLEINNQEIETDVQESPAGFYAQQRGQTVKGPFGQTRKDRWRPFAPAGVSIGHPRVTGGTLGTPPLITQEDERVFLVSGHTAAPFSAEHGDSCLQPGKYDGGTDPEDKIGELLEWSDLSEDEVNTSDSALVKITGGIGDYILGIGRLRGWTEANYDEEYTKSGRTTGTTNPALIARDMTALVNYGSPFSKPLRFTGLDVFDAFSAGGDSGSLIGIQRQNDFYGTDLLFAGSTHHTLGIPMDAVQEQHGNLRVEGEEQRDVDQRYSQREDRSEQVQQGYPGQQTSQDIPDDSRKFSNIFGRLVQKRITDTRGVLFKSIAISLVFFIILSISISFEQTSNIPTTHILIALIPFIAWLVISGRLSEFTGPGGLKLALNNPLPDVDNENISTVKEEDTINIDSLLGESLDPSLLRGESKTLARMPDDDVPLNGSGESPDGVGFDR